MTDRCTPVEIATAALEEHFRTICGDDSEHNLAAAAESVIAELNTASHPYWLARPGYRQHGNRFRRCPRCDADLMAAVGIVELAYVYDPCVCDAATYTHLVEQMWHRTCHAAEAGEKAVAVMDASDALVADARREALAGAIKTILAEANRGKAVIPPRQHVTYAGGLRRAARILDGLLGKEDHRG